MAHFPKPFFRTTRNAWFVQVDGKQVKLAEDKDAAFKRYHELMAAPAVPPRRSPEVGGRRHRRLPRLRREAPEPPTYRWYKDRLQLFVKTIPADLTLDRLKPFHVQRWIDGYPDLSSGSKRNHCRSVVRCMNWAEEQGYVARTPLAHFKKPAGGSKELVVTPEQYQALLDRTDDQEFRDLLTVTWETGCRPQESLRVEARHVEVENGRWLFPKSESKNKRRQRIVYLTPKALEITKRLMEERPSGPLFRNTDGLPWTTDATNCRFQRIKKQKGVKFSLYALRHSFAHHAMTKGVDSITVATFLGHADPNEHPPLGKHQEDHGHEHVERLDPLPPLPGLSRARQRLACRGRTASGRRVGSRSDCRPAIPLGLANPSGRKSRSQSGMSRAGCRARPRRPQSRTASS